MSSMATLKPDVIIVGSGPGGVTLSRELARRGKRVLLGRLRGRGLGAEV